MVFMLGDAAVSIVLLNPRIMEVCDLFFNYRFYLRLQVRPTNQHCTVLWTVSSYVCTRVVVGMGKGRLHVPGPCL